jgi:thymidylate synthase
MTDGGFVTPEIVERDHLVPHKGIYWEYGDLQDLVEMLATEPYTRQAWIPLFFPEDTGIGDKGRKPCTLGYQFLVRDGELHMYYPLRSCDFIRHWRDDCYLAVRLLLWVLDRCRHVNPDFWADVVPGTYAMHMTSLHIFSSDVDSLMKSNEDE